MTESEAKTKWCPMVRRVDGPSAHGAPIGAAAFNRFASPQGETAFGLCVGSACMMWRVTNSALPVANMHDGYCGLAGKP